MPTSSSPPTDYQSPGLQQLDWELESLVEEFEVAVANDPRTDVSRYFPPTEHPRYAEIVCELLRVDMEIQATAGRLVSAEEYRQRFPKALEPGNWFQLLKDEQQRLGNESELHASSSHSASHATANGDNASNDQLQTTAPLPLTAEGEIPQAGQHVCGFDLLAELGRGAFSRVYLALEKRLSERLVVIKVSSELPGEAETLSRLQHKNIVPVYSLHRHSDHILICMPYLGALTLADVMAPDRDGRTASITGESLVSTLAAKASRTWKTHAGISWSASGHSTQPASTLDGSAWHADGQADSIQQTAQPTTQPTTPVQLPDSRQAFAGLSSQLVDEVSKMNSTQLALWLVCQLAEGLCHAHERGILHRDIKPANILLSDDGMPMLLDFNLAAQTHKPTSASGIIGGTLRYMAPEQLQAIQNRQQTLSAQADVYSLGVVLFELLFQRPPFVDRTGTWSNVLAQMQSDRQQLAHIECNWRSGITPGVIAILQRALAYSLADRYTSADELRNDLLAQLEHKPLTHASNTSLRERVSKWNARHPRLSATTIVGLVAVIFLTVTTTWFMLQQSRMKQVAATNWLHELEHAQTAARTLLASSDVPDSALDSLLAQTQSACEPEGFQRHARSLSASQSQEARSILARIHFYRARGAWSMFTRHHQSPGSRDRWLSQTMKELNHSNDLSPQPLTSLWLETLQPLADLGLTTTTMTTKNSKATSSSSSAKSSDSPSELVSDPHSLVLESLRANLRLRDSNETLERELAAAQQAVAAEAGNPWHWVSVGQLQLAQRRVPEARGSFSLGQQLAPAEPLPAYLLGITELRLKNFPAALRWFDIVLDRDPHLSEALFNRAIVKTELGKFEAALEDLDRMSDQMERYPRAWFVRELVLRKLGRTKEANDSRSRGLAITPVDALGWNARGEAWLRESSPQLQQALDDFDRAIAVDPHYRNAYENAAHVLAEKMNRTEQAIARLDAILAIDPTYALAMSSRSVLHARSGNAAAARADYQQALAMDRAPIICYQAASALALLLHAEKDSDAEDRKTHASDQQTIIALLKETLRKEPALARLMRTDQDLIELSNNRTFQELLRAAQTLQ